MKPQGSFSGFFYKKEGKTFCFFRKVDYIE